jgi:hypothetical protein
MNSEKIIIKIGSELSPDTIKFMVDNRIREYGENTKDFENNERESIFFFLQEDNATKAFGMLKPVILYYQDKEYPIMGLANVIAIEKSRRYGTKLMKAITDYLETNNIPALGNTHNANFDFYKKCGFSFYHNLIDRMIYRMPDGKESNTERENYDMFVYDPKEKLSTIVNGEEEVIIKVPFW